MPTSESIVIQIHKPEPAVSKKRVDSMSQCGSKIDDFQTSVQNATPPRTVEHTDPVPLLLCDPAQHGSL
ncbi:8656_t:CDS:1, partial [Ambispora gerdemannii]